MAVAMLPDSYRPNAFDKAGRKGTQALQQVLNGDINQIQAAEMIGSTQGNVSKIIKNIKDNQTREIAIGGNMPITEYAKKLELENITNKIKEVGDGIWEVNPLAVMHHNIIRLDIMLATNIHDFQMASMIMGAQVKISDILLKHQPHEETTLDINKLYSHADMAIKFIPLLHDKINEQLDGTGIEINVKKLFLEYIRDVKGKDYVFED